MQTNQRGRGRGRSNRQPRGGSSTNPSNHLNQSTNPRPSRPPRPRHPDHPSVPPYVAIHPGSGVSIILKADQPTGHQVYGIVADLLTRGDHPRGVKVRLRDGRVGRVQRLVNQEEGERGEAVVGGMSSNLGRNGNDIGASRGSGARGGRVERDIREDDEYLYDENRIPNQASLGLFAALEEADQRHQKERGWNGKAVEEEKALTCPVCGEFEGDERAVAYHVESHFEE
jgi:uncharacterized repeat protein (TIGR03833 family)